MEKIEIFVKLILKMIFYQAPFDREKANESFEEIKKSYKASGGKDNEKFM
ncbi:MAG: hypothetical protein IJC69_00845 [Clostridia bacterium]|nr:hypothetical protein [Clostridia bacterium]